MLLLFKTSCSHQLARSKSIKGSIVMLKNMLHKTRYLFCSFGRWSGVPFGGRVEGSSRTFPFKKYIYITGILPSCSL